jgi:SAM-dependent methyltransferase
LLAINFMPDSARALRKMIRVTRPGGVVAAAVWDYGDGMQILRVFWDEAVALDPAIAGRDERNMPLCRRGELAALWRASGLERVEELPIDGAATSAFRRGTRLAGGINSNETLRNQTEPRRHGGAIVPIGRALGNSGGVPGPKAQTFLQPHFLALKRVDALAHARVGHWRFKMTVSADQVAGWRSGFRHVPRWK